MPRLFNSIYTTYLKYDEKLLKETTSFWSLNAESNQFFFPPNENEMGVAIKNGINLLGKGFLTLWYSSNLVRPGYDHKDWVFNEIFNIYNLHKKFDRNVSLSLSRDLYKILFR